jgi:hypothetical protein
MDAASSADRIARAYCYRDCPMLWHRKPRDIQVYGRFTRIDNARRDDLLVKLLHQIRLIMLFMLAMDADVAFI